MIKVICFDVDGTLIDGNSWLSLTEGFGCSVSKHVQLYEDTVSGKITFEKAERELVKLWQDSKNATKENLEKIYSNINLRKEAEGVFKHLRNKKYSIYLVSGSNKFFVERIAKKLKPDDCYSSAEIILDKDNIISQIDQKITKQGQIKVDQVNEIAEKHNASIKEIYFVGDSENDIDVFIATGRGISVHCQNDYLKKIAWKNIESLDRLREIL